MVCPGQVTGPGHLDDIEGELHHDVRPRAVFIGDPVAVFLTQPGVHVRNRQVDRQAMSVVVRHIVRQRAQSESVFIDVTGVVEQGLDEIARPDIMSEITEQAAPERVVAHVLDDAAPVCISVCISQLRHG